MLELTELDQCRLSVGSGCFSDEGHSVTLSAIVLPDPPPPAL